MKIYKSSTNETYYEGQTLTRKIGNTLFSGIPTEEQLSKWGFEEYTPPKPEPKEPTPPTEEELQQLYVYKVRELIREKYAIEDELAIQRQRYTNPDRFNEYNDFCEQCKVKAREEVYGE